MFKKLLVILLFIAIGAGLGGAVAHFQPASWQVQAQFEKPKMADLGNYFSLFSTYSLISGDNQAVDMAKMETKASQAAYNLFKQNLASQEQRMAFLSQNVAVKQRADIEGISAQQLAKQLATDFQIREQNDRVVLTFNSFNLAEVDGLFVEYVREINQQTRKTLNDDLINQWKALFQQVKSAADAKLDPSWNNKLTMMQSVQPLDNNLVAFHFTQNTTLSVAEKPYLFWAGLGALAGLFFSLLALILLRSPRTVADN